MSDASFRILEDDSKRIPLESLLLLLDQDREWAGEKYELLRRKLIKFFEWNSCFPSEDLADETFNRLGQRIGKAEIRDVVGFTWGIARNVRREARKKAVRTVYISDLPGEECPLYARNKTEDEMHEKMQQERRYKCLHLCLGRMLKRDRELFIAYHNAEGDIIHYRQQLADQLGLTIGTLRVRVNRLRSQLEQCSRKCFDSRQLGSKEIECLK
jgi:RNA polymerase sigma factor (sigma-70 family)